MLRIASFCIALCGTAHWFHPARYVAQKILFHFRATPPVGGAIACFLRFEISLNLPDEISVCLFVFWCSQYANMRLIWLRCCFLGHLSENDATKKTTPRPANVIFEMFHQIVYRALFEGRPRRTKSARWATKEGMLCLGPFLSKTSTKSAFYVNNLVEYLCHNNLHAISFQKNIL